MTKKFVVLDAYNDDYVAMFDSLDEAMTYCEEFDFPEYSITYFQYFSLTHNWYCVHTNNDYDDEYSFAICVAEYDEESDRIRIDWKSSDNDD